MLGKDYESQECLVARALEVVGERWTLLIIRDAFFGVRHFNDFQEHLDAPRAVLSKRLKTLVDYGVMIRTPDPQHRGRELYELTEAGEALWPVVYALRSWAQRYAGGAGSNRIYLHERCGQQLTPTGSCACSPAPPLAEIVTALPPNTEQKRSDRVSVALAMPHRLLEPLHPTSPAPA